MKDISDGFNIQKEGLEKKLEHVKAKFEKAHKNEQELQTKLDEVKRLSREETNRSFTHLREEIANLTRAHQELTEEHAKEVTDIKNKEAETKVSLQKELNEKEEELL